MKRIGIIGHFGADKHFLDGQTVKTRILYEGLKAEYKAKSDSNVEIVCVDTYYNNTNKIKLLLDTVKCIALCRTIIILLSINGMKLYFPIMYWVKKIFKHKIFHHVIGGNLAHYVKIHPQFKTYLNSFDGNWVEFEGMKKQLEKQGIFNCLVIPNFKSLDIEKANLEIDEDIKCSFCMFSRVMEEKGITEAVRSVEKYNREHIEKIQLNIWGPIDDDYSSKFETLLEQSSPHVKYKGIADYDKSVETLTNHLALLFPTYWDGEGFPGTIVDAYASALPVIATDWNANSELIDNFKTGWTYPNEKVNNLYESLEWATNNKNELLDMRKHCHEKARSYNTSFWIKHIITLLEK